MNKRGISGLIEAVLLVVIVVVAVSILWIPVGNLTKTSLEKVSLQPEITATNLELSKINQEDDKISFVVKRIGGEKEWAILRVILESGGISEVYDLDVKLNHLEAKLVEIDLTNSNLNGDITGVVVYPVFKTIMSDL